MVTANVEMISLSELIKDSSLYPRKDVFWQNVESLAEALRAGATLPPIVVCRDCNAIIDGYHRHDAYVKFNGGMNIDVSVEYRDYEDHSLALLDAIRLNAGHGQKLSTYDIVRSTKKAEEMGLTRDQVADAAGWTRERIDKSMLTRTTATGETIKRTNAHLAGKKLSEKQAKYNQFAGGMSQKFYLSQVNALIESDSMDYEDEGVVEALILLTQLMKSQVAPALKAKE